MNPSSLNIELRNIDQNQVNNNIPNNNSNEITKYKNKE